MRFVLVDRDGTVNERIPGGYVARPEDLRLLDGALDAFRRLADAGIGAAIVTNQAGVGRGLVSADDVARVNAALLARIHESGGRVEAVYCCPHAPDEGCACRKPAPGLVERALSEHGFAPEDAVLVGDSADDVAAARRAGVRTVLVLTGRGADDVGRAEATRVAPDFAAAVDLILAGGVPADDAPRADGGKARP